MRRLLLGIAVFLVTLVSCYPDEVTGPQQPAPEFLIGDGAHGGNSHFFFLPPLVPRPQYSGTPDGTLSPVVEVCELTSAAMCGQTIARFTTAPGQTLLEQIRYDRFTGSYYVVWDTRKCLTSPCTLDPSKRYRLRVSVAGAELGWADIDVVGKLQELKGVEWGTDVGAVQGLPLPIRFRIEEGAISVIALRESIHVSDAEPTVRVGDLPPEPLSIVIHEKITTKDRVRVSGPLEITLREIVRITDAPKVVGPLRISLHEVVHVLDSPGIVPPATNIVQDEIRVKGATGTPE